MHVVGSIVFFWYGKCQCLPYCRTNVGAHNTVRVLTKVAKHPSSMAWRYCPAGAQGTVLGIVVDLSALPYLLRLILGSSPSGHPWLVVPSRLRPRWSEKSCKQRFGVFPVGKAGRSQKRVLSPPWPGLPVGDWIALSACR